MSKVRNSAPKQTVFFFFFAKRTQKAQNLQLFRSLMIFCALDTEN